MLTDADIARLRSYKPGARTVEPESVPPQVEARALRREDFEGAMSERERWAAAGLDYDETNGVTQP